MGKLDQSHKKPSKNKDLIKDQDDIVNEASDESFPCSDPPAWIFEKPKHPKHDDKHHK